MLLDPTSDPPTPFYVGKGEGNRIFDHLNEAISSPSESDKLDRIRAIRTEGKEVLHVVLRHDLTPESALEVEGAFIDFLDSLTNIAGGYGSRNRGLMTVDEVIAQYEAPAVEVSEPALLIRINRQYRRGMSAKDLYEATRKSWVVGNRRSGVRYGIAVAGGIIREVYTISEWYRPDEESKRWAFHGQVATDLSHYIGGSVAHYFAKGEACPVKYLNC